MKVGIIGGGINGLFIAWRLSNLGYSVELYETGKVLEQTSSSSSKLLHGGIRYLEHGHFGLVIGIFVNQRPIGMQLGGQSFVRVSLDR